MLKLMLVSDEGEVLDTFEEIEEYDFEHTVAGTDLLNWLRGRLLLPSAPRNLTRDDDLESEK